MIFIKFLCAGAGERAQELNALAAFPEDWVESHHIHGSSQQFVTSVPGAWTYSPHLHRHQGHMESIYSGKTPMHVQ